MTSEPEKFADVGKHVKFLGSRPGLTKLVESLLGYRKLRKFFSEASGGSDLFGDVARRLDLSYEFEGLDEKLPSTGPVVVVANHAYGGADALALAAVLTGSRSDAKLLANHEVAALPGVKDHVIAVDILSSGKAISNSGRLLSMIRHVKKGGCLGVFPAGRVALWQGDRMKDPPWNEHVVSLLQRLDATVVPVWFFGSPPALIKIASKLSGFVRTALIPTGAVAMKGQTVTARVGEPFDSKKIKEAGDQAGIFLRSRLERLQGFGN